MPVSLTVRGIAEKICKFNSQKTDCFVVFDKAMQVTTVEAKDVETVAAMDFEEMVRTVSARHRMFALCAEPVRDAAERERNKSTTTTTTTAIDTDTIGPETGAGWLFWWRQMMLWLYTVAIAPLRMWLYVVVAAGLPRSEGYRTGMHQR